MSDNETEVVAENTEESPQNAEVKQNIISASNPTPEEMQGISEAIKANYNFDVIVKPTLFNFKKSTDKISGIETIREAVQLPIPYPSMEGIVAILETGGKGLELLVEAVEAVVNAVARDLLYEDTTFNAASFPVDKLAWEVIANMPKAQRRGGGIPKETWEEFAQDYVEVMPEVTGKTIEQVANAAKILMAKLSAVRTNEPVLQLLVQQLALYAESSPKIEEYQECVAFLLQKADTYLNVSEEELLANL